MWLFRKKVAFIILASIGVGILVYQVYNDTSFNFGKIDTTSLISIGALAVGIQLVGHWLRAVKHRYLLEQIRPIRTTEVFKGQMIGFLFNTILPFRIGELVRAHYIGKGVSISRAAVFATIIFERLFDSLVVVAIGLLLFSQIDASASLHYTLIGIALVAVVLAFILYSARTQQKYLLVSIHRLSGIFNDGLRDRCRMICWAGIYCLKNAITARLMPRYIALTATMWLCYLLSAFVLITALVSAVPAFDRILANLAVYFSVSVPSGPAYLHTFRDLFTDVSGLTAHTLQATNIPFALWLLLSIPTVILGLGFLAARQRIYHGKTNDVMHVLKNKLYRDADITKEFSNFLDAYFKGDQINRILTSEELAGSFQVIKTFKGGSNALTLLAWQDEQMVVKKITLKQYQEKLEAQYQWLFSRRKHAHIAKALAEHTDHPDFYAIDIEYRDDYIPFFDVIHASSISENKKILLAVCEFVDKHVYRPVKKVTDAGALLDDYITHKVIGKITDAANGNLPIAHLLTYDSVIVNGKEVQNFSSIIETITQHPQAMADLKDIIVCPIQGDLTIDNLIVNPDSGDFIILDPNNENAISDPIVDYAKLMQSVHSGYEFLYSLPACTIKENHITFEERRSVQYDELYKVLTTHLKKELSKERYRAILFHEAVHYCRMLTYRVSINPDTAAAFYCIAVRLFNEFMEQYDEAKS
jgi:hypothetical protein